jgi:hypothetical protein
MILAAKGQMMYVGGLKDDLPEGYGVKFTEGLKFEREKMGIFSAGKLDKCVGYAKEKDGTEKIGYFSDGVIVG